MSAWQRPKLIALVYRVGKPCSMQYPFATVEELEAWAARHPYRNELLKIHPVVDGKMDIVATVPAGEAAGYLRNVGAAAI